MEFSYRIAAWLLFLKFSCLRAALRDPIVRVEQGLIRGWLMDNLREDQFYAFTGIPFAKPPVGNLRFQPPQPAEPWRDIYNATTDAAKCPQMDTEYRFVGDENCLTLNVFCQSLTPDNETFPVFVFIHGGSFTTGSATLNDVPPARLMSYSKFVLVVPQYRLSSLGFLSTGDSAASGNFGLLDQIMALQWVQKNIGQFGGDPRKVTVGGLSAGAMSIGFHLVSPLAIGLFRGTYIMSGSALMNVALQKDPLRIAKLLGKEVRCRSNDTAILVDCLRGKTFQEMIVATVNVTTASGQALPFCPTVEEHQTGRFLLDYPEKLYREGKFIKVPTIIGTTKDEIAAFLLPLPNLSAIKLLPVLTEARIDQIFNDTLPPLLGLSLNSDRNLLNLSQAVRREYSGEYNLTETKQFFQFLSDMGTDATFRAGADKQTRYLVARSVKTYLYAFDYHADFAYITNFGDKEVSHGENAVYFVAPVLSTRDSRMSDMLITQLLNFLKYLNPNGIPSGIPKWMSTPNARKLRFLRYTDDGVGMDKDFYTGKMMFWEKDAPEIMLG